MRVIAAYLLLSQSGNKPSADDVTSFLKGPEIEVDESAVKAFFEKLGEQVRVDPTSHPRNESFSFVSIVFKMKDVH